MSDNKDSLPALDAKIVSDIVDAVLTSTRITVPASKVSLKEYVTQAKAEDHDLSVDTAAELFDIVHYSRGTDQFYDLTVFERDAEVATMRAAFDLGRDGIEELREALAEAEEKVKQLEEEASRPLEMPKFEEEYLYRLQSEAWKAAVEWINKQDSEAIDLGEMEAANPYEPDVFPPTENGTVIAPAYRHRAVIAGNGLEFFTLTYVEPSDWWVGVDVNDEEIWYFDTKDIKPGTWTVVK